MVLLLNVTEEPQLFEGAVRKWTVARIQLGELIPLTLQTNWTERNYILAKPAVQKTQVVKMEGIAGEKKNSDDMFVSAE